MGGNDGKPLTAHFRTVSGRSSRSLLFWLISIDCFGPSKHGVSNFGELAKNSTICDACGRLFGSKFQQDLINPSL